MIMPQPNFSENLRKRTCSSAQDSVTFTRPVCLSRIQVGRRWLWIWLATHAYVSGISRNQLALAAVALLLLMAKNAALIIRARLSLRRELRLNTPHSI
jgi:hypothetical protein